MLVHPGNRPCTAATTSTPCWSGWPRRRWRPASSTCSAGDQHDRSARVTQLRYHVDINTLARRAGDHPRAQRDRPRRLVSTESCCFRPLRARTAPPALHPHRPDDQRHGRRRHGQSPHGPGVWDQPAIETLVRTRSDVQPDERAARYGQQPVTVLLTGLTGAASRRSPRRWSARLFDARPRDAAARRPEHAPGLSAATSASPPRNAPRTSAVPPRSPAW